MPEFNRQLLDINDAAKLLNVSVVSLRRWTNSGRLPCLRVGGKRERRFYREDLLAFAEQQAATTSTGARDPQRGRLDRIVLEGIPIDYGSHLCLIYESDQGRSKMAVPFLIDGLASGDACYLVAPRSVQRDLLGELDELRPGSRRHVQAGQLTVPHGIPNGGKMFAYFESEFLKVTRPGNRPIRVVGDMAWFLDKGLSIDEVTDFEMRFDRFLGHSYPVISLCLYDARRFCGIGILHALKTHEDTFRHPLSRFLVH